MDLILIVLWQAWNPLLSSFYLKQNNTEVKEDFHKVTREISFSASRLIGLTGLYFFLEVVSCQIEEPQECF